MEKLEEEIQAYFLEQRLAEKHPDVTDKVGIYSKEELSPVEFSAIERLEMVKRLKESIKDIQDRYGLLMDL